MIILNIAIFIFIFYDSYPKHTTEVLGRKQVLPFTASNVSQTFDFYRLYCFSFVGYTPFLQLVRTLFGNDIQTQDIKAVFRKIATNPDAEVDWGEVEYHIFLSYYFSVTCTFES